MEKMPTVPKHQARPVLLLVRGLFLPVHLDFFFGPMDVMNSHQSKVIIRPRQQLSHVFPEEEVAIQEKRPALVVSQFRNQESGKSELRRHWSIRDNVPE